MAGELKVTIQGTLTKGSGSTATKRTWNNGQLSVDVAATGAFGPQTLSIGTAEEAITFTDITTEGWLFLKNLDGTNYVQWGPESAGAMVVMGRLKPGEEACFRMDSGATLRLKANTAACNVDILLIPD